MARLPRFPLAGMPQHVVQRGNDKQACFHEPRDYRCYLSYLAEALTHCECALHAYALMGNHVHLLVTPQRAGGVSHLMQCLGRRYVRAFNTWHGRTGTLWEGRYKSGLVDSDHYLLACYRYIEMNSVRAGLVDVPGAYRWSSFHANAAGRHDSLVTAHPTYLALGRDAAATRVAYRKLFDTQLEDGTLEEIRRCVSQQVVLGSEGARNRWQTALQRRTAPASPGRRRRDAPAGVAGELSHWLTDSDPD